MAYGAYGPQSSCSFLVHPPSHYSLGSNFPCTELGYYSVDENGYFYDDKRELRRLNPDYLSIRGDLTEGKETYVDRMLDRPLDPMLNWITKNACKLLKETAPHENAAGNLYCLDADFVTMRGIMKRLLATVFDTGERKKTWKFYAVKYNGTIYVALKEDQQLLGWNTTDGEMDVIFYMGKKFEEVVTVAQDHAVASVRAGPEDRRGFYTVSRGIFGNRHQVVVKSEVDCIEEGNYIEMKLRPMYSSREAWKTPLYKLREWWYHMYAGDMKKIVYGIRDGPRLVRTSSITLDEIPSQIQQYPKRLCPRFAGTALQSWNPRSCIGFVDEFLQWLKEVVVEDNYGGAGPSVQYLLEWDKVGYREPEKITCSRVLVENCSYVLLPEWFTNEMATAFKGNING